MANGNSIIAFVAGAITGAALLLLANTEKGEEVIADLKEKGSEALNNGRDAVLRGLDKIEDSLNEKMKEKEAEEEAE